MELTFEKNPENEDVDHSAETEFLMTAPDSTDSSDPGSDDDLEIKQSREKRLNESGGWWAYITAFTIFLPYLVPRNNIKIQACMILGIATDQILTGKAPYRSLFIWLLLSCIDGESGIGLVEELVKIPIRQYSYQQVSNAAFAHVLSLDMDFHAERDTAEVMKVIEQGSALTTLVEVALLQVLPTTLDIFIAAYYLCVKFNIIASLGLVLASVGYVWLEVGTSAWISPYRRRATKSTTKQARLMHQAVQGWQIVSLFNMFAFEKQRFGHAVEKSCTYSTRWSQKEAYGTALTRLLVPLTFSGLACLILRNVVHGTATAGDFVFFIQYWDSLIYPMTFLSTQYRWIMTSLVDAERLLFLLQTKPSIVDKEDAHALGNITGKVDFKDVNFSYDSHRTVLDDINFSVSSGQTIAFVGPTSAGKSTITKLLLRMYDIKTGSIKIDGHDIRDVTLSSLRDAVGVVPQDPLLFNTTIMENLRYAKLSATDEEIFDACRAAAIHDQILGFTDGYDSTVGEQGVKLSGGERQRIAIARVLLKDAPILILDEATSAVDTNTESEIQLALDRLKTKRTVFVVAHRLSTIVGADLILIMDEGRIAERGTHQELLKLGGRYKSLWTKQVGGYSESQV